MSLFAFSSVLIACPRQEGVATCLRGCDAALASAPEGERLQLLVLRAWCRLRAAQWALAADDADNVLAECAPENALLQARCVAVIGRALLGTGQLREALAALQRAVELGHATSLVYASLLCCVWVCLRLTLLFSGMQTNYVYMCAIDSALSGTHQ